ncbi:MAG: hypothetical protein PHS81_04810, partial [Candidatus Nanoarchaeia archaeon]|nr:hypothetical protein [Candidatus Nanoarchaeia archaeon]
ESLKKFLGGVGPILRTISYEEFCTTKEMVCSSKTKFTNTQDGGEITFTNCPQDSVYTSYFAYTWPVGLYCSLFGNDIDHIMSIAAGNEYKQGEGVGSVTIDMDLYTLPKQIEQYEHQSYFYTYNESTNSIEMRIHHMPMIDRDANERLYHYLWNYESCVENFGERVPPCGEVETGVYINFDEKGNPTHPFLGGYTPNPLSHGDMEYVKSRGFCQELWKNWPQQNTFDWMNMKNLNENNYPAITINGTTYPKNEVKKMVETSCIYWHEPFLDAYYSNTLASQLQNVTMIVPPIAQWPYFSNSPWSSLPSASFFESMLNMYYCDRDGTGLVKEGFKCNNDYPFILKGQDRNCNLNDN